MIEGFKLLDVYPVSGIIPRLKLMTELSPGACILPRGQLPFEADNRIPYCLLTPVFSVFVLTEQ